MLEYPQIDPVAIAIGPLRVHWYGLMYLIGFGAFLLLGHYRAQANHTKISCAQVGDLLFYGIIGTIVGGRVGYMLAYNFGALREDPVGIFFIWEGGMSFHGGLIGVLIALWVFAKKHRLRFLDVTDFTAPLVPTGLGAGRIGNFINGELWGRISDSPWAMVFPHTGPLPRHPSQLYEFFLEGVVLFVVLWIYSSKPRTIGRVSALFAILYATTRFAVEFFRQPDAHIGFIAWGWLTLGQVLSLPLLLVGILLLLIKPGKTARPLHP